MEKFNAIIICTLAVIVSVFASCSKERVVNVQSPMSLPNIPNTPIVPMPNNYPADTLTGREFIFNNLSWRPEGIFLVSVVNRPDLFYLYDRPLNVSISVGGSPWMNLLMCPFPTDPFYFVCLPPGILKIYHYNYPGPLLDSTTSLKVRFL